MAKATDEVDGAAKEQEEEERPDDNLAGSMRRYGEVVHSMQHLVQGYEVDFDSLTTLTAEEREALEELAMVLRARDKDGVKYIYAEQRLSRLNHTLAVLQPVLGQMMEGTGVEGL